MGKTTTMENNGVWSNHWDNHNFEIISYKNNKIYFQT